MKILTIVPPETPCVNNCPYCIAKMFDNKYENKLDISSVDYFMSVNQYANKLKTAWKLGFRDLTITGLNDPMQHTQFLNTLALAIDHVHLSFNSIEVQTSGINLNDDNIGFLKYKIGVTRIALSVNSFDQAINNAIRHNEHYIVDFDKIRRIPAKHNINIRLCYNLLDTYDNSIPEDFIKFAKYMNADEILFRRMFSSGNDNKYSVYVNLHSLSKTKIDNLYDFVISHNIFKYTVFNTPVYDVNGIMTVFELEEKSKHTVKSIDGIYDYLILRSDCNFYDDWDSTAKITV